MINADTLVQLRAHAEQCHPMECCGVVVQAGDVEQYVPCRNIAREERFFIIHPDDYAAAEAKGRITHIAHSHANKSTAAPSAADVQSCNNSGVEWVIVNSPGNDCRYIKPTNETAPYVGREYVNGVFDCATLFADYYWDKYGIKIEYEQILKRKWWEDGHNYMLDQLPKNGFRTISEHELREGDIILMQIRANVPNHIAVYLGGNVILQQCYNKLSGKTIYGGFWRKHSVSFWRHHAND